LQLKNSTTTSLQIKVSDPLPPDTLFYKAAGGAWDGVVCMDHDQGLGKSCGMTSYGIPNTIQQESQNPLQ